jgi:hypothetical protein
MGKNWYFMEYGVVEEKKEIQEEDAKRRREREPCYRWIGDRGFFSAFGSCCVHVTVKTNKNKETNKKSTRNVPRHVKPPLST